VIAWLSIEKHAGRPTKRIYWSINVLFVVIFLNELNIEQEDFVVVLVPLNIISKTAYMINGDYELTKKVDFTKNVIFVKKRFISHLVIGKKRI
jgi:hypothetical protein